MIRSDDQWLAVVDRFGAAALDGNWEPALAAFAKATGSRSGQLIGFGSAGAAFLNCTADREHGWMEEFAAQGGTDIALNPRMRAGLYAPVLELITDPDVSTAEERRQSRFYSELLPRYDIPHICASVLVRQQDAVIGLAVLRSRAQGEISPAQRQVFASMASHVRAAARTQMALENQGAQLLAGALEAVSLTAFVCDRHGGVRAMTPGAEALVSTGGPLRLLRGRLRPGCAEDARLLDEAVLRAGTDLPMLTGPAGGTVLIGGKHGAPLALEVIPLPRRAHGFGFEPRALILVRNQRPHPEQLLMLLQQAHGLTRAEAEVAAALAEGRSKDEVAAARGVSINTVRSQIQVLFTKLGVRRQGELIAKVNGLR